MNERIEEMCKLLNKLDDVRRECGVIDVTLYSGREVHMKHDAFFQYFDEYKNDETFIHDEFDKFYRIVDGICFFCLDYKGDVEYE